MFENMTYEYLLKNMLDRVPNSFDKREGSIIFNGNAPSAAEMAELYILLGLVLDEGFAETASYYYLVKKCKEEGIYPKPATNTIVKGEFNIDIQIGSRFSLDNLNYVVIEKISTGVFKLECEDTGPISNLGNLIPIEYIEGLQSAILTEIITLGTDDEDVEDLRERYLEVIRDKPTSGNPSDYKIWAKEVVGVGDAKVFPTWNGRGTVKVLIIDRNNQPASQEIITETFNHIENVRPIGATVTVVTAQEKSINTSTRLLLANGYSLGVVQEQLKINIDSYFKENTENYFKETTSKSNYISIAKIGTVILSTEGVLDYSELKLNNLISNIPLGNEEIPTLGTLNLEV